jgi:TRAP-type C4-dicarboxylate transport system permease small subunit
MLKKIDKFMQSIETSFEMLGGLACIGLMFLVIIESLGRYVFKRTLIAGGYNITEGFVFPALVFLGISGSYRMGLWPRLEILTGKMSPKKQMFFFIVTGVIELALYITITIVTAIYGYKMTLENKQMMAGSTTYPLYPILIFIPFAFLFLSIEVVLSIWKKVIKS